MTTRRERYVWPAVQGDEIWCQLFSEPAGGSDVAGLRTKAEKQGDEWVINGQKIWTTGAQFSDYGILLTRTDANVPKHKGPDDVLHRHARSGGGSAPIKQASGGSGFNEVSSPICAGEGQPAPRRRRPGLAGRAYTLMYERLAVGGGQGGGLDVKELMGLARTLELEERPRDQERIRAREDRGLVRALRGPQYTTYRTMTALSQGKQPGAGSVDRLDRRRLQAAET